MATPVSTQKVPIYSVNTSEFLLEFYTYPDFEEWVQNESAALWSWIGDDKFHPKELFAELRSPYETLLREIKGNISKARPMYEYDTAGAESRQNDAHHAIKNATAIFQNNHTIVTSESAIGKFVIEQKEKHGGLAALWTLNTLSGSPSKRTPDSLEAFEAIARATTFEQNQLGGIKEIEKRYATLVRECDSLETELSEAVKSSRKGEEERNNRLHSFVETSKKEIEEAKDLYFVSEVLKEPVKYWKDKTVAHEKVMKDSKNWGLSVAGVLLLFLGINSFYMPKGVSEVVAGHILAIISVSTFLIWLIRLAAKIYVANMHLRDDANERVTMMLAFLALNKDVDTISATDTGVIYNALFRPASSGLIKDDGVNSPIELIHNIIKKDT